MFTSSLGDLLLFLAVFALGPGAPDAAAFKDFREYGETYRPWLSANDPGEIDFLYGKGLAYPVLLRVPDLDLDVFFDVAVAVPI